MDKNDLYNAFDKIDPALVTRSEEGNCFAEKKAKRSFAEKGRGRMIIPLIIVPLAVIAAITVISVTSYKNSNNRTPKDTTVIGPTSVPLPAETEIDAHRATPDPTTESATSPATPMGTMPSTYVPPDSSQLLPAIDAYMKSSGFADAKYPDCFNTLAGKIIDNGTEGKFDKYTQDDTESQTFYAENYYFSATNNSRYSVRDLTYSAHVELSALPLPFEIDFGDFFIEVMDKMGVAFPENAGDSFSITATADSDGFPETYEIHFYRTDRTNLGEGEISFDDPSQITYTFTQKNNAGQIVLERTMCFGFMGDDPSLSSLTEIYMQVRENYQGDTQTPDNTDHSAEPTPMLPPTAPPSTPTASPEPPSEQKMKDIAYEALSAKFPEFARIPQDRFYVHTFVGSSGNWDVDYYLILGGLLFRAINYSYCYYADRDFSRCFDHCYKGISFDTFSNDFTDAEMAEFKKQLTDQLNEQLVDRNITVPDNYFDDPEHIRIDWTIIEDSVLYLGAETIIETGIADEYGDGHAHLFAKVKVLDLKPYLAE